MDAGAEICKGTHDFHNSRQNFTFCFKPLHFHFTQYISTFMFWKIMWIIR